MNRRGKPPNRCGCKPTEDVCVAHDEPLQCRHGCSNAYPHKCKDHDGELWPSPQRGEVHAALVLNADGVAMPITLVEPGKWRISTNPITGEPLGTITPPTPTGQDALLAAAIDWIAAAPHGENCYVSDHYEGDPGNRCNCGKESIVGEFYSRAEHTREDASASTPPVEGETTT